MATKAYIKIVEWSTTTLFPVILSSSARHKFLLLIAVLFVHNKQLVNSRHRFAMLFFCPLFSHVSLLECKENDICAPVSVFCVFYLNEWGERVNMGRFSWICTTPGQLPLTQLAQRHIPSFSILTNLLVRGGGRQRIYLWTCRKHSGIEPEKGMDRLETWGDTMQSFIDSFKNAAHLQNVLPPLFLSAAHL